MAAGNSCDILALTSGRWPSASLPSHRVTADQPTVWLTDDLVELVGWLPWLIGSLRSCGGVANWHSWLVGRRLPSVCLRFDSIGYECKCVCVPVCRTRVSSHLRVVLVVGRGVTVASLHRIHSPPLLPALSRLDSIEPREVVGVVRVVVHWHCRETCICCTAHVLLAVCFAANSMHTPPLHSALASIAFTTPTTSYSSLSCRECCSSRSVV